MPKWNPDQCRFVDRPEPDDRPGDYYVSAIRRDRFALLLGPFRDDLEGALARVADVRRHVSEHYSDPWGEVGFGTCRLDRDDDNPAGRLNAELRAACRERGGGDGTMWLWQS